MRSSQGLLADRLAKERTYDAFGVFSAVERAQNPPGVLGRTLSRLQDVLVSGVSMSALILIPGVGAIAIQAWPSPFSVGCTAVSLIWTLGFVCRQLRLLDFLAGPPVGKAESARTVAVVGAGPVGLAVLKECAAQGLDVTGFERKEGVGGVFRFDPIISGGVWDSARLTTSPWVTAFADFPPETESTQHLRHDEYLAYLERYARHFNLLERIQFGCMVQEVSREEDGRWCIRVRDERTGEEREQRFDRVTICSGSNLQPRDVSLPGLDGFKGQIRHAASYKGPDEYRGKRIVVVGMGESGADIATELADCADTTLSIRRGKFLVPRVNPLNGLANDYDTNRVRYATPFEVRNWYMRFKRKLCFQTGEINRHSAFRAQMLDVSGVGPMSQTVTKNDDIIDPILEGRLRLRREVVAFEGPDVIFADGLSQAADLVLFAHGFDPIFPFLCLPKDVPSRHPGDLYLNMFYPELGSAVSFCGFARPAIGAIPPTGELQARYVAQIFAGSRVLPTPDQMRADIEVRRRENERTYPALPQPNLVISWIRYMDKLAGLIGCRPDPWRLMLDPWLLWKVTVGPMTGSVYRIHGPGASEVAQHTVRRLPRMHQLRELLTLLGMQLWLWPLALFRPNSSLKADNHFL